ncbi:TetR/AcrR family transcriptional regulator [Vibrio vulnificus]|uniref:TetR/AcrR family transcriptional regulator n=1 Tax=Vibrio vulnificus TaxID=672 RepID=UPI001A92216C|nr:TetR/AcrR family transcriptional regulator [Vibrio vulnificus]
MNDTNKKGRPRTFDEDEALLIAMKTFWAKGYDGTSMKDLSNAMGISGPSIYSAFGDKRELYLKCIDRYSDVDACAPVVAFESQTDIEKAVFEFLEAVIDYSATNDCAQGVSGCFLASCVSTNVGEVEGVADRMTSAIMGTDTRLAARFDKEIAKGNLPNNFPSLARAQLMFDMRQGYVFRGRAGWTAEELKNDLHERVKMILSV